MRRISRGVERRSLSVGPRSASAGDARHGGSDRRRGRRGRGVGVDGARRALVRRPAAAAPWARAEGGSSARRSLSRGERQLGELPRAPVIVAEKDLEDLSTASMAPLGVGGECTAGDDALDARREHPSEGARQLEDEQRSRASSTSWCSVLGSNTVMDGAPSVGHLHRDGPASESVLGNLKEDANTRTQAQPGPTNRTKRRRSTQAAISGGIDRGLRRTSFWHRKSPLGIIGHHGYPLAARITRTPGRRRRAPAGSSRR